MVWQDVVIAVCQLAFIPAMLPTVFGKDKPAFATNVMNFTIVTTIASCLASLHLWFAAGTAVPIALIWLTLAIQTRKS
jgi:hypothetical protein